MDLDIIWILTGFVFLGNLLIVISEPVELNPSTIRNSNRHSARNWKERNNRPPLPSMTDDVAENRAKISELEDRLLKLESKYEAVKIKNEAIQRRLSAQEELHLQQKRLVAKLKKIVGPVTVSRKTNPVEFSGLFAELNPPLTTNTGGADGGASVATVDTNSDVEEEQISTSPAVAEPDVDDEAALNEDLLQINEYLGNREAELVALNPNGDELVAASANDFGRVSSNPSLYGQALLHLDGQNQDLTDRFEDLLRSVEEYKNRASLALSEAMRSRTNGFGISSHVTGSLTNDDGEGEDKDGDRLVTVLEQVGDREDEGVTIMTSKPQKVSGKCAFSVASSTSQLGIQDVAQVVKFDYTFSNKGGNFKMANNSFVCSIPGYYYFSFSLRSYDNRYLGVSLMKNDDYQVSVFTDSSERNVMESQSVTLHLDLGDFVWLRLSPSSKFGLYSDQYHFTTFTGLLIYKGD